MVLGHGLQHIFVEGAPYGGDSDECGGLQRMDRFDEAAAGGVLVRPLLLVVGEGVDAPGGGHQALYESINTVAILSSEREFEICS